SVSSSLSLHDALPICANHWRFYHIARNFFFSIPFVITFLSRIGWLLCSCCSLRLSRHLILNRHLRGSRLFNICFLLYLNFKLSRSEEHTSELQSRFDL